MNHVESHLLLNAGLNMLAVFDLDSLPQDVRQSIQLDETELVQYRQLLVFGHAGKDMWRALQQSPFLDDANPIDSFSIHTVKSWFEHEQTACHFHLLYPGPVQKSRCKPWGSWPVGIMHHHFVSASMPDSDHGLPIVWFYWPIRSSK